MMRFTLFVFFTSFIMAAAQQAQVPETYVVLERYSKRVLLASGSEYKRPIGNLSNLVTAKVTMDWMKAAKVKKTDYLIIPHHYYRGARNPLGLQGGDKITFRDALYASILSEDCVAPTALALHVGQDLLRRRGLAGNAQATFVTEMNHLARRYGMFHTRFFLPCGADTLKKNNYSTASDLVRLAVQLAPDTAFGFYTKQKKRNISVVKSDGSTISVTIYNTNKMLTSSLRVAGLKAGGSLLAKQGVVLTADRYAYSEKLATGGERITPVQLIIVALGSSDVKKLSQYLIPQGWSQYEAWRKGGYIASKNRREFLATPQ